MRKIVIIDDNDEIISAIDPIIINDEDNPESVVNEWLSDNWEKVEFNEDGGLFSFWILAVD